MLKERLEDFNKLIEVFDGGLRKRWREMNLYPDLLKAVKYYENRDAAIKIQGGTKFQKA